VPAALIARQQNVLRLDVAVDDALRVRERERIGHIADEMKRSLHLEAPFAPQPVP
jgi:hypothetical protein